MTKTQIKLDALRLRNETMVKVEQAYLDAIDAGVEHSKALKDYQDSRHATWQLYKTTIR